MESSTISHTFPTYKKDKFITSYSWLDGKRLDDNAEGLWRIHDTIYDLTSFIDRHPGGSDWLTLTKGTDITEAFESHHFGSGPAKLLEKYKVRDTKKPRNYKFTFKDDGFYRTLKRRVEKQLPNINRQPVNMSKVISDTLLAAVFVIAILSVKFQLCWLAALNGVILTWMAISSHNFFHQRDNFRMYYFNFTMMSYREWRISHALSHHIYTNSLHDLEMAFFEPFLSWFPHPEAKNLFTRYASWCYGPFIWSTLYFVEGVKRIVGRITKGDAMHRSDFICYILPATMMIFGGGSCALTFRYWVVTMLAASFSFGMIGLNAAHHNPDIVHDGDALKEDMDWGIYQLDTVLDRSDIRMNHWLNMTHFGNHALHHLFPTLDHGILPQLYPILFETVEEFNADVEAKPWIYHIIGQMKQLARIEPQLLTRDKRVKKTKNYSMYLN